MSRLSLLLSVVFLIGCSNHKDAAKQETGSAPGRITLPELGPGPLKVEVKESPFDHKPATVATYPGGIEIHYRKLGPAVWVGREAIDGLETGRWLVANKDPQTRGD